jgi:ketosteroid isomerase-like protein
MSKASRLFLVAALMLPTIMGCQQKADVATERPAIEAVLDDYITSIENEDMTLYAKIIAHDPNMVNFGTDAVERIVGWDALEKLINAQNEAWSGTRITASDITVEISSDGRCAWATSQWDLQVTISGQPIDVHGIRCTWVLEKLQAGWVIVHFHKSVGMGG